MGSLRKLRMLFLIPTIFLSLIFIVERLTPLYHLYPKSSLLCFFTLSQLFLLSAFTLHSSMVHAGRIPFLLARPQRKEFIFLVHDILHNSEFQKLKDFFHHTNHIYDHSIRVSYISYAIAKALRLNYRCAARGGLLHDFFLYDWRERKATDTNKGLHGREHPHIALANAKEQFTVTPLEEDIILKHMFPKTLPLPRYKESFIVSLSDKISSVYEYYMLFQGRLFKRMHQKL